jgi:hypothetical protein
VKWRSNASQSEEAVSLTAKPLAHTLTPSSVSLTNGTGLEIRARTELTTRQDLALIPDKKLTEHLSDLQGPTDRMVCMSQVRRSRLDQGKGALAGSVRSRLASRQLRHFPLISRAEVVFADKQQGFVLLYCHVSQLQLEAANVRSLHTANAECPQCKATGRVPMHHGLRDKECPRCGGRWWVRSPSAR